MNKTQLQQLLNSEESGWLDFKQEMYKVFDKNAVYFDWQKCELVRDILALANGNTHSVQKTAYIVIGVGDEKTAIGKRDLFDVGEIELSKKQVMDWVNAYAEPPLEELYLQPATCQNTRLLIIEIPPSRYVHRIRNPLQTKKNKVFPENVVFIRNGEEISVASPQQAQGLEFAKRQAHAISRYFNPVWLLGISFAVFFATFRFPIDDIETGQALIAEVGSTRARLLINGSMALIMGAAGAMVGWSLLQFQDFRLMLVRASPRRRVVMVLILVTSITLVYSLFSQLFN